MNEPTEHHYLRYRVVVSNGTVYIWLPLTGVGIAPSFEEWEILKERVDRLFKHASFVDTIKGSEQSGDIPARSPEDPRNLSDAN